MHFLGCRILSKVCTWRWSLEIAAILVWSKAQLEGACSERVHRGECQLWGSRLASCSLTVAESWASSSESSGLQWGQRGETGKGLRQLRTAHANSCGAKISEVCGQSTVSLMTSDSFSGKICWYCRQSVPENHSHPHCRADMGRPCLLFCFFSLFLAFSLWFSFAPLGQGGEGWGETKAGILCYVPKGWENWSLTLLNYFFCSAVLLKFP